MAQLSTTANRLHERPFQELESSPSLSFTNKKRISNPKVSCQCGTPAFARWTTPTKRQSVVPAVVNFAIVQCHFLKKNEMHPTTIVRRTMIR